jgi:predicted nuclease with TOPRIM domain
MDLTHLRERARNLRIEADQRRKDAMKASHSALDYRQVGDETRAQAAESDAAKFNADADQLTLEAERADGEANEKERQISDIEVRQSQLRSDFDRQMGELEKEKQKLTGISTTSLLF